MKISTWDYVNCGVCNTSFPPEHDWAPSDKWDNVCWPCYEASEEDDNLFYANLSELSGIEPLSINNNGTITVYREFFSRARESGREWLVEIPAGVYKCVSNGSEHFSQTWRKIK